MKKRRIFLLIGIFVLAISLLLIYFSLMNPLAQFEHSDFMRKFGEGFRVQRVLEEDEWIGKKLATYQNFLRDKVSFWINWGGKGKMLVTRIPREISSIKPLIISFLKQETEGKIKDEVLEELFEEALKKEGSPGIEKIMGNFKIQMIIHKHENGISSMIRVDEIKE